MVTSGIGANENVQRCVALYHRASTNNSKSTSRDGNIKSTLISTTLRIMDVVAIIVPITFLATTSFLESVQPGYDRMHDTISSLVWGRHGWSQTVVFYLGAFVLAYLALRLYLSGNNRKDFRLGISLIAIIAIGFVVIAIFPTKAPGSLLTVKALAHRQTARMVCFLFPLACLFVANGLRVNSNWSKIRILSLVISGLGVALFVLGVLATISESPWLGALERVMLANGLSWCEVMVIKLGFSKQRHQRVCSRGRSIRFPANEKDFHIFHARPL